MDTKLTIDEIELDSTYKAIDWEQRRYEIAKDSRDYSRGKYSRY